MGFTGHTVELIQEHSPEPSVCREVIDKRGYGSITEESPPKTSIAASRNIGPPATIKKQETEIGCGVSSLRKHLHPILDEYRA
jgi:hypothetical protein